MQMLVQVSAEVHRIALRKARELGDTVPLSPGVLNAPLDAQIRTWISDVWDKVEGAIARAWREGMAAARSLIDAAMMKIADVAATAAQRAADITAAILERLGCYLREAVNGALKSAQSTIVVGEQTLEVASVTVDQQVRMSGSLKVALEGACEFVAEGQIALQIQYARSMLAKT